jgi:plastocyanin
VTRTLLFLSLALLAGCTSSRPREKQSSPAYFKIDPASAGRLRGRVMFEGKAPPSTRVTMDADPDCERLHGRPMLTESVVVNRDGTLANVFVYVKSGLEGKQFEPAAEPVTIDQKGCWFRPHVIGLQTGQKLRVTNSDPVSHNIHPLAKTNREWNQNQSPGAAAIERRFARPEIIPVKCNIHSWMRAWIGVVDHPYFAVTGDKGSYEIGGLPPGDYTVEAWHESLGTREQKVSIPAAGYASVSFAFR